MHKIKNLVNKFLNSNIILFITFVLFPNEFGIKILLVQGGQDKPTTVIHLCIFNKLQAILAPV